MSYNLTFPANNSQLTSQQVTSPTSAPPPRACCENGRPVMTDPTTGQTICSCQYGSALLNYPRLSGLTSSLFGSSAYGTATSQGYVGLGAEGSAFYAPLTGSTGGQSQEAWRSLTQPAFSYDPSMGLYPYGPGYGGLDLNARRKNATRESTTTLKAWLNEHIKNPYPTKGEKIMLAIITKMTLTQVSTWFANARRRLKKENRMTWSPRNRGEDDDSDDEKENEADEKLKEKTEKKLNGLDGKDEEIDVESEHNDHKPKKKVADNLFSDDCVSPVPSVGEDSRSRLSPPASRDSDSSYSEGLNPSDCENDQQKPKIWSVSDFLHTTPQKLGKPDSLLIDNHSVPKIGSGMTSSFTPVSSSAGLNGLFTSYPSSMAYSSHSYPYSLSTSGVSKLMSRSPVSRFNPYSTTRPVPPNGFNAPRDFNILREGE
ncbi:hypothetical protein SNE40_008024 [Patella caerulea]|uniref:Homeobox domain-containing protein n=2 Tax=Patellogastropoda TaxID=69675 RepID=A0AAN8K123_PATCE